jgi:HEAT repeat protein
VSGNPRGRPRIGIDVRALARKHGPEAFQTLVTLMRGDDARVAVRAAEAILDRAYGRPVQAMELLGAIAHVDVTALSDAELRAHVSHLREQLQPVPPDAPESPARLA